MTGFELRIWRRGFNWSQERAAEELGVSLRSYITYEQTFPPRIIELAAMAKEMVNRASLNHDLFTWRRKLKWTQKRAAVEMGVSLRTYITYENATSHQVALLASATLDKIHGQC